MTFTVITNPKALAKAGFTNSQFKKLDALYLRAAAEKVLNYRTVEVDFDEGVARYTYYKSESHQPFIQFVIAKVGPNTMMYEVYKEGKGRINKSGLFDRSYQVLKEEIEILF